MGKSQTRRSVSVKGITYQRMKNYAEQTVRSVSGITEEIVNERLDALGVRTFTEEEAEALRPKNSGEPPLPHPDSRANDEAKEAKAKEKAKAKEAKAKKAAQERTEEAQERRARNKVTAKEPSAALAPRSPKAPRGGGVHSF